MESLEELTPGASTHRYIFLDAWDIENMQDPGNFAKILQLLSRTRWKTFITSRSDHNYITNCGVSTVSTSWLECKIEPEDTKEDIQKYIRYKIDNNSIFQGLFSKDEKLRHDILRTLSEKTNGL